METTSVKTAKIRHRAQINQQTVRDFAPTNMSDRNETIDSMVRMPAALNLSVPDANNWLIMAGVASFEAYKTQSDCMPAALRDTKNDRSKTETISPPDNSFRVFALSTVSMYGMLECLGKFVNDVPDCSFGSGLVDSGST